MFGIGVRPADQRQGPRVGRDAHASVPRGGCSRPRCPWRPADRTYLFGTAVQPAARLTARAKPSIVVSADHGGFLVGEYGQMGKPAEFAAKLREVRAG